MNAIAPMVDVPPSCPAASVAVAAFSAERWGVTIDTNRWAALLDRRERIVRTLRAAGDPRAADAAGWLMLAGVLAELPAQLVRRTGSASDPGEIANAVATATSAGHGPLRAAGDGPPTRFSAGGGLDVVDAGSRSGFAIADVAGRAAVDLVVAIDGTPVVPTAVRRLLRERITNALELAVRT